MRRCVAGNHTDAITAIGNPDGIERIETLGHARPEQAPILLTVSANIDIEDKVVTIIIVRRPARRDRGAVPHCSQGSGGWVWRVGESILSRGEVDADLLWLAWLGSGLGRPRARFDRNLIHHR